jgi:hypothetical protein
MDLHPTATLDTWSPFASSRFTGPFVVDDGRLRRFNIEDRRSRRQMRLTFCIGIADARSDGTCPATAGVAIGQQRRLRFPHTSMDRLGLPNERGRAMRRGFAANGVGSVEAEKLAVDD